MKTYLTVWFNSEGTKSSEITDRLMSMGFRPIRGNYDYIYDWGTNTDVVFEEVVRLADRVYTTLNGCNVFFKLETVD